MSKNLRLFNLFNRKFLLPILLTLSFFLPPTEVLCQSGRIKQETKQPSNSSSDSKSNNQPASKENASGFSLNARNFLRVENQLGNITILPSQNNNFLVQATERNTLSKISKNKITIEENNNQVYLKVPTSKNAPVDLKIFTPVGVNLRLLSDTGNIDVSFTLGSLVATTKTGNINLSVSENIDADLSLSSTFGAVRLTKFIKASATLKNNTKLKSFHQQLGKGGSIISIYSEQGNINLETNQSTTPDIASSQIATNFPNNASGNNNSPSNKQTPETNSVQTIEPNLNDRAIASQGLPQKPVLRRSDSTDNPSTTTNSSNNSQSNNSQTGSIARKNDASNSNNSSSSSNGEEDGVIKIESQLVTLNATAVTSLGQPVVNLSQTDFSLFEDGVSQEIVHFQSVNSPFNLVLLIDLSGSVREKLNLIRRSALAFIQATRPEDKVAIITFSGSAQLVCPLTNDRNLLRKKVNDINDAESGTNFYDALVGSISWVLRQAKNERNAIVIMSDGVDNNLPGVPGRGSKASFEELLDKVKESDTIIFPIYLNTEQEVIREMGLFIPEAYAVSRQNLQALADTTGGSIFYANQLSDLTGCYEKVAAELRTIYSLGYYPTNGNNDGSFRKIRVRVKKDDVKVKTRRGYYAKNT
jgi:VWFA-related protein